MKLSQRIAANTFALAVTQVICRIISFVLVLAIARHYATEKFGQYTFALSFIELFMVLADLGISKIMVTVAWHFRCIKIIVFPGYFWIYLWFSQNFTLFT